MKFNVLGSLTETGETVWAHVQADGKTVYWKTDKPEEPQFTQENVEEVLANPPFNVRDLTREVWSEPGSMAADFRDTIALAQTYFDDGALLTAAHMLEGLASRLRSFYNARSG